MVFVLAFYDNWTEDSTAMLIVRVVTEEEEGGSNSLSKKIV